MKEQLQITSGLSFTPQDLQSCGRYPRLLSLICSPFQILDAQEVHSSSRHQRYICPLLYLVTEWLTSLPWSTPPDPADSLDHVIPLEYLRNEGRCLKLSLFARQVWACFCLANLSPTCPFCSEWNSTLGQRCLTFSIEASRSVAHIGTNATTLKCKSRGFSFYFKLSTGSPLGSNMVIKDGPLSIWNLNARTHKPPASAAPLHFRTSFTSWPFRPLFDNEKPCCINRLAGPACFCFVEYT